MYWGSGRWIYGGDIYKGVTSATGWTGSFALMDALIKNVTKSGLFPSLRQVSIIGFSAGSQFSLRYAFSSAMGADLQMSNGLPVHFIISDPGSYLYLNELRPDPVCRPYLNNGVTDPLTLECASFGVPPELATDPKCSDYNVYKVRAQFGCGGRPVEFRRHPGGASR